MQLKSLKPRLILASASPRRKELLTQIGVQFQVAAQDIDESRRKGEQPLDFVTRIAGSKADSALAKLLPGDDQVILAADTVVVCDSQLLGKPEDQTDGQRMLLSLSNRSHRVLTAVTLADRTQRQSLVSESTVSFGPISKQQAAAYWLTGEPADKAGGYAIQGRAAVFVKHISGSYSGIVGLPLFETAMLLEAFDIPVNEELGAEG